MFLREFAKKNLATCNLRMLSAEVCSSLSLEWIVRLLNFIFLSIFHSFPFTLSHVKLSWNPFFREDSFIWEMLFGSERWRMWVRGLIKIKSPSKACTFKMVLQSPRMIDFRHSDQTTIFFFSIKKNEKIKKNF